MPLLITGTPGSLFDLVCDLLVTATKALPATATAHHCSADAAWSSPNEAATGGTHLFITNYPNASFLNAVWDGSLLAVVVLDTPLHSLLDLREAGHEATVIARNLSACATQLGELSGSAGSLYLGPETRDEPRAALRAIVNHTSGVFSFENSAALNVSAPVLRLPSTHEIALVDGVLDPAFHFAATGEHRKLVWPRIALYWGDHPDQPAPAILDLTGPARVVVFGPYFHIPPGDWIAQAQLAFSPGARGAKLALEFHGAAQLAGCSFQVQNAGRFQIALPVHVPSARETIELRLVLQSGAIEGHLGLDDVQLIPIGHGSNRRVSTTG